MTLANNTPYRAGAAPLVDAQGRPVIVAVVKATFTVDAAGRWTLADDPSPVRWNDVLWYPEAPDSSVRYPSDAVPEKVGTDILFVGEAVPARAAPYVDIAVQARSLASPFASTESACSTSAAARAPWGQPRLCAPPHRLPMSADDFQKAQARTRPFWGRVQ